MKRQSPATAVTAVAPKATADDIPKSIDRIRLGAHELDAAYASPYPIAPSSTVRRLSLCPRCLKYDTDDERVAAHTRLCRFDIETTAPIIYADDTSTIQVREFDGAVHKLFAQCLCLLARTMIATKTVTFDTDNFLFYTLTVRDDNNKNNNKNDGGGGGGRVLCGYFSKEKSTIHSFNLSCLLTFPHYQQRGYGRFLIALSYALSHRLGIIGGPERPLSDLGRVSYLSYWTDTVMKVLSAEDADDEGVTMRQLSARTGIDRRDIALALASAGVGVDKQNDETSDGGVSGGGITLNSSTIRLSKSQRSKWRRRLANANAQRRRKGFVIFDESRFTTHITSTAASTSRESHTTEYERSTTLAPSPSPPSSPADPIDTDDDDNDDDQSVEDTKPHSRVKTARAKRRRSWR